VNRFAAAAPELGNLHPTGTAGFASVNRAESAIQRCQSVMAAQSGVTQRVRHGCAGGAHIAAVLGSDVIIGLAIGSAPQRQCALVPEAHVTGTGTWPGSVKET
jgi:hypothetical protein